MGFLTVRDKGMGQAGGGIVGPTFQLFQTTPIPGLSFPGGYGYGISTPYHPPAQGGSGGFVQGTTYAAPTPVTAPPPTQQPPQYQPPQYQQQQPTNITVTTQQQPAQLPVYYGGGGQAPAPAPAPAPSAPVVTEEAMVPVIFEEEKKSDFPWWILLAVPAAMLAMKHKT